MSDEKYELSRRKMLGVMGAAGAGLAATSGGSAAASTASAGSTSASQDDEVYDVGVIGLGAVGSFAAQNLAERGLNVLGLEAGPVAHDDCGVGGDTRLFWRLAQRGVDYRPLLERSFDLYSEIAKRADAEVFRQNGLLFVVDSGGHYDRQLSRYARRFDLPHERLTGAEIIERYPQYQSKRRMIGHLDLSGGYLRSDRAVIYAVTRAEEAGMTRAREQVTGVKRHGDRYRIHCRDRKGSFSCRRVVFSAGARTRELLPGRMRRFFTPVKYIMEWFSAKDSAQFTPDKFPTFMYTVGEHYIYGVPSIDDSMVKAAGFNEGESASFDGFDFDSRVSLPQRRRAADRVGQVFAALQPNPVRMRGYPDMESADGEFVMDYLDSDSSAVVATGFSGSGFKMAPAIGEHVAQLITGDANPYPAFSLSRFG